MARAPQRKKIQHFCRKGVGEPNRKEREGKEEIIFNHEGGKKMVSKERVLSSSTIPAVSLYLPISSKAFRKS